MIENRTTWVSGYRILWMLVMFDLPVVEKPDRKAATGFRNFLLDQGFSMAQYSVYFRMLSGKEATVALSEKIKSALPQRGKVSIITITDKQYAAIQVFKGQAPTPTEKPQQLTLF